MKLLLALTLLVVPAFAQDGPVLSGDVFILTKEEAQKINEVLEQSAATIQKQRKQIEWLKATTGCS